MSAIERSNDRTKHLPAEYVVRKYCGECGLVPPWCDHDRAKLVYEKYMPEADLRGAVCLTGAEWERVLWLLQKPVAPGPMKALDEEIIRKINHQRGQ